jgi:ribonuclease HI
MHLIGPPCAKRHSLEKKRMGTQKKYYAVSRGFLPGIYTAWYGPRGAEEQVRGYAGAIYKGFTTLSEAQQWIESAGGSSQSASSRSPSKIADEPGPLHERIVIYTDGGCMGNPGPGGYGAIILDGERRTELSRGFRMTTNNRMELMACIAALDTLKNPAEVLLHSDSRYVVNGIGKGWASRWRANGWMRTKSEAAENADLWEKLLDQCSVHRVRFVWVHGHAGDRENERCDRLANDAAQGPDLQEDHAYVQGRTRIA